MALQAAPALIACLWRQRFASSSVRSAGRWAALSCAKLQRPLPAGAGGGYARSGYGQAGAAG